MKQHHVRQNTLTGLFLLEVDIVQVVERYLGNVLVQRGENKHQYLATCPFHTSDITGVRCAEKTPSFAVIRVPRIGPHGFFHCHGCLAHGTAIQFVMRQCNNTFDEAVAKVTEITGVHMPRGKTNPKRGRRRKRDSRRRYLAEKNRAAQDRRERANDDTRRAKPVKRERRCDPQDFDIPF